MNDNNQFDVVIVGAGIAGLTAGWLLRDKNILVLESSNRIGGRIKSVQRGEYWLNFGAHVFSGAESQIGKFIDETGAKALSVPGILNAVTLNGKILANGPVEFFPFRLPMSFGSRIALIRKGLKLKRAVKQYAAVAASRLNEEPSERQMRMLSYLDDYSFSEFIGELPDDVDSIFRATLTRSSGNPEEIAAGYGIGYFHLVWNRDEGLSRNIIGGSSKITENLAECLKNNLLTNAEVISVLREKAGVKIIYKYKGEEKDVSARAAIVATPAYTTKNVIEKLPEQTTDALQKITYGSYVVVSLLTKEQTKMPWDRLYALATPKKCFNMLFNTANILRSDDQPRKPGGSLMMYAGADFAKKLFDLDDNRIISLFINDLESIYPQIKGIIEEAIIQRWEKGLPFPFAGRSRLQSALTTSIEPVYLAGDYLGTWYTETAMQTAIDAALKVKKLLLSK